MKKKQRKQSNKLVDKIASVASVLLLILAWYMGGLRIAGNQNDFLNNLLVDGDTLQAISSTLYQGNAAQEPDPAEWISVGTGIGYGGEMEVALTVSPQGEIKRIAVLSSKDTSSYLEKVMQGKLLDDMLGRNIKTSLYVDGISGATLSSNGLLQAANSAADSVRKQLFGYTLSEQADSITYFRWLDFAALVMFAAAVWVSKTRHPRKNTFNWVILLTSMGLFGFYSASPFSSSTMGIFVSGTWISGLGNYTALILLLLSAGYILAFNKNVYCQSLCPFGATQECLAKIGNAKAVTFKHSFFVWFPRVILLAILCFGVYFRNPASFSYEPFGIMFGMIGTLYLFVLTVLVLLTSLMVRRPWCKSLCPMNAMTDFLKFNKTWAKQTMNGRKKPRGKRAVNAAEVVTKSGAVIWREGAENRSKAS
ncbi:4Fe-4S binding protein [Photobacterium sagamiensis]|uniref:FMN-binding protein n=1 Tax=Photobacterium sagamiensis TaxID=2910241 RepID=UPI003D1025F4